jgi:hypothetical protein
VFGQVACQRRGHPLRDALARQPRCHCDYRVAVPVCGQNKQRESVTKRLGGPKQLAQNWRKNRGYAGRQTSQRKVQAKNNGVKHRSSVSKFSRSTVRRLTVGDIRPDHGVHLCGKLADPTIPRDEHNRHTLECSAVSVPFRHTDTDTNTHIGMHQCSHQKLVDTRLL